MRKGTFQEKGHLGTLLMCSLWAVLAIVSSAAHGNSSELQTPSYTPFDLSPLVPAFDAQIPKNNIILKTPNVPEWKTYWDLAREAAKKNDFSGAISQYLELLEMKGNLAEARWELVLVLLTQEMFAEASEHLDVLLEMDPENATYALVQAVLAQRDGHFERSLELFRRHDSGALFSDPYLLAGQANAFCAVGNEKVCFDYLTKLLAGNPGEKQIATNYAIIAYQLGEYELAWPYVLEMARAENASPATFLMAARLLDELKKNSDAAEYWLKIVSLYPDDCEAHGRLANYYEKSGQPDKALDHLLFLQKKYNKAQYLKRIGRAYLGLMEFTKALETFEEYIQREPEDKEIARNIIKIHAAQGDKEETLSALEHYFAIEAKPDKSKLRQAAELYDEKGSFQEAISIYRRLLELTPDDPELLWSLADNLLATGQEEDSLKAWQQLAAVSPGVVEVYKTMAELLQRLGRKRELVPVLTVIHELEPGAQDIIFQLAELYFDATDFKKCMEMLLKFDTDLQKRPQFYRWRGTIRESRAEFAGALADFEKILLFAPEEQTLRIKCVSLAGKIGDIHSLDKHASYIIEHKTDFVIPLKLVLAESLALCRDFERARLVYRLIIDETYGTLHGAGPGDLYGAKAYVGLATSFLEEELHYEAEQVLRQGLEVQRDFELVSLLFDLALSTHRLAEAQQWFTYAEGFFANEPWSLGLMEARLLAALGEERNAREKAEELYLEFSKRGGKWTPQDSFNLAKQSGYVKWQENGVDLARLFLDVYEWGAAEKIGLALASGDPLFVETQILLEHMHNASKGAYGVQLNLQFDADFEPSRLYKYAVFLHRYEVSEELLQISGHAAEILPGFLWPRVFQAEAWLMLGEDKKAYDLYSDLNLDYPENHDVQRKLAKLSFKQGDLDKAEMLCQRLNERSHRVDSLEMQSRILWMKHERERSIDIFEEFLTPTVDRVLQAKADELGLLLPSGEDNRSFWDLVSFVPNEGNSISRQVLEPLFMEGTSDIKWKAIKKLAADQYARYRWQDKFSEELKARRFVVRREYILAAKQYERFVRLYPDDLSVQFDLAEVYSQLGRLGDEAALYEKLADKQVSYPELSVNAARIRIKQRPYVEPEYGYDEEEGRRGYKNRTKSWYGLTSWYSPWSRSEIVIAAERSNYEAAEGRYKVRANRLQGEYRLHFSPGLSSFVSAGLHDVNGTGGDSFLFSLGVDAKLGDKLSGEVLLSRDVVDDTVASLTRDIASESLEAGLTLDILPRLEVGGDYKHTNYSDNNWTTGYDLRSSYILFSEPTLLQIRYLYDFKESQEAEVGGVLLADGFASDDHPYWAPKNHWQNSFGLSFKHILGDASLEGGTPLYYTAEYYFGHDSDGYAFQTVKGGGYAEITAEIFVEGSFEISNSQSYRKKQFVLSAAYRW